MASPSAWPSSSSSMAGRDRRKWPGERPQELRDLNRSRDKECMRRTLTLSVIAVVSVGAILAATCRSDLRGEAKIALVSIASAPGGDVTANFQVRHSNGLEVNLNYYVDGVREVRISTRSRRSLFAPAEILIGWLNLNPERLVVSGSVPNSGLFGRLLMRVGD